LSDFKSWGLCICEVVDDLSFKEIRDKRPKTRSMEESFHSFFIETKSKFYDESDHKNHKSIVETFLMKLK
jgi:hypothetical protein